MPRFITIQARRFRLKFREARSFIREKYIKLDHVKRDGLDQALLQHIQEMDSLLRHVSVRGHMDPKICEPKVDQVSSIDVLLQRLKAQVKAASVLAEATHLDMEANPHEAEALSKMDEVLDGLYDIISPENSLRGY